MAFINSMKKHIPLLFSLLLIVILIAVPTGYEDAVIYKEADRSSVEVLEVDNSAIISSGLIRSGEQYCQVRILGGKFKGQEAKAYNLLSGSLESDKIFKPGDKAVVMISYSGSEILSINMVDHYRIPGEMILAALFVLFLILFAGKKGLHSLLSFVVTVLMVWKVMIPCYLKGMNPVIIGLLITAVITVVVIGLVYGGDVRSVAAISGSLLGVATTCIFGIIFTDVFKIHGAVMTNSTSLLYAGYENLNLTHIFMSGIFIGASGAMMDLAVDITSAVHEVIEKKPSMDWKEATRSGINVGRAAMGTMTTTLLLAYSGGYIAQLMIFMAQGTPMYNILNYKYIAAEILDTVVGSFGLVTVAPFTAVVSGILLTRKRHRLDRSENI